MTESKLTLNSPRKNTSPPIEEINKFALGAQDTNNCSPYKVEKKAIVYKNFLLRIPEEYHLKLAFIADKREISMQRFIQKKVLSLIDQEISEIEGYNS
jgi:predicted HicB family RNase H-like nuclease